MAQGTPTRGKVPASAFTFRFARGTAEVPLSENAQRLMNELRERASEIKVDMQAQRDAEGGDGQERKFAKPKGKASRFSAAHIAEFKKMDSIEGHASLWRTNRTPPVKSAGLKRSPCKAELDGTPTPAKPSLKRKISKANLGGTPQSELTPGLPRSSSRAKLDDGDFAQPDNVNFTVSGRSRTTPADEPQSTFAKRIKKFQDEDTSKSRPVSRGGSTIPRPKSRGQGTLSHSSSLSRLASPTKASLGHSATPTKPTISLVKSTPSKPEPGGFLKLPPPTDVASLSSSRAEGLRRRIISPGRFQKVKSILRGQKSDTEEARTALPKPALQMSQTPGPSRITDKEFPPQPFTTPRRKLVKHVAFTPDTKHAAESQNTPSPQKFAANRTTQPVQYPALDGILTDSTKDDVVYPDLSGLKDFTASLGGKRRNLPHSVPGTFTFRADHTIDFGSAPSGFGASPGQASIRHVQTSMAPKGDMPGSFPAPPEPSSHPNKENKEPPTPKVVPGIAHGFSNKKRRRVSSEEADADKEGADRGAKKRKNEHATPRKIPSVSQPVSSMPASSVKMQTGRTPIKSPGSASPTKKKGGLSMSRLNMLARPKNRA